MDWITQLLKTAGGGQNEDELRRAVESLIHWATGSAAGPAVTVAGSESVTKGAETGLASGVFSRFAEEGLSDGRQADSSADSDPGTSRAARLGIPRDELEASGIIQQLISPVAGVARLIGQLVSGASSGKAAGFPAATNAEVEAAGPLALGRDRPGSVLYEVLTGQGGAPRPLTGGEGPSQALQWSPTIHINVSTIDSRGFLDHSYEIAECVRQALINSHPLRDVILEL